jgi:hypothetical protein
MCTKKIMDGVFGDGGAEKARKDAEKKAAADAAAKSQAAAAQLAAQQSANETAAKARATAANMGEAAKGIESAGADVRKIKRKGVSALRINKTAGLAGDAAAGQGVFVPA